MLPPFYIRNLRLPSQQQDALVRISPVGYDNTISSQPAAMLKYPDEDDGDTITVGSSQELIEKLEEPVLKLPNTARSSRNRMPIPMFLAGSQQSAQATVHHTFDIDDREDIQELWQNIQKSFEVSSPPSSPAIKTKDWTESEDALLIQLRNHGMKWDEISKKLPGRGAISCRLHYQNNYRRHYERDEENMNKVARAYERYQLDYPSFNEASCLM